MAQSVRQLAETNKKLLGQRDEAREELAKLKADFDKMLDIRTEAFRREADLRTEQQQASLMEADRLMLELSQATVRESALEEQVKDLQAQLADAQIQIQAEKNTSAKLQAKLTEDGIDRLRKRLHNKTQENEALQRENRDLKKAQSAHLNLLGGIATRDPLLVGQEMFRNAGIPIPQK